MLAIACSLAGIIAAYAIYVRKRPQAVRAGDPRRGLAVRRQPSPRSWAGPGRKVFEAIAWFDQTIIDGAVNGAARGRRAPPGWLRRGQTGNVRNYAEILGVGVVLVLAWFVIGRGVL